MDTLAINLNSASSLPLYEQIYIFIKSEIQSGRIPPGAKLPSKRKLSSHLKVSQNTIQAAYNQLIEEGYVTPEERRGFFVCKLDQIQKMNLTKEPEEKQEDALQHTIAFDFTYNGVDKPSFPFSVWRKLMKDVINENDSELLQTGSSLGSPQLRAVIADYLHQSRGVNCRDNQIIISSGTEVMYQLLIQLFSRDTVFGIENPGYQKLKQVFISNKANVKAIGIDRSGIIPEEVHKAEADILCITPSHQFPTGEIMPINRRLQLLNWANEQEGRYLIEDDYDSEFKYSTKPVPSLQGLDTNEKIIYMGSFSKSISPTIRVSYMVLPAHLMKRYQKQLSFIICPVPIIEQKVLYHFIKDGYFERHLSKMRNIYKKKRDVLVTEILNLNKGIEILGADAGLHLLIKVPNGMSESQLIQSAKNHGIRVYAISEYYYDKSLIDTVSTIMLGYAVISEDEIRKAVQILNSIWFSCN